MYRLLVLVFLLAVFGGADKSMSLPADRETAGKSTATADMRVDVSVPQNDAPVEYPEKAEVVRLLVRASELESNDKFQDAFAVTIQVVVVDPASPKANEMKARLKELLRRIQVSPQLDERTGNSEVAQRTMPLIGAAENAFFEIMVNRTARLREDVRSVVEKSDGFSSRRSASAENQIQFPQRRNRHPSMSI